MAEKKDDKGLIGFDPLAWIEKVEMWDCQITCCVADVNQQGEDVGSHSAGGKRTPGVENPVVRNHLMFRGLGKGGIKATCGIRFGDGDLVQRFFKVIK